MSPQSIVCATCDATVPYGRLSCPACGELLASVAGAARSANGRTKKGRAAVAERPTPAVLTDVPPTAAASASAEPERAAPGWEPPIFQTVSSTSAVGPAADTESDADAADKPEAGVGTGAGDAPRSTVAWPADLVLSDAWPAANAMPPAAAPAVSRPPVPIPDASAAPGAYVPPIVRAEPSGPAAPARAWAGQAAAATAASKADAPRTSAHDLIDATRITEFVGWLAVAGSAMAAVGFLLPWGVSVIGASGIGYFDRWGLAGPFHPVVLLSLLAVLGLSLIRNPVPVWLRVGVLGLGLGSLLLGLTWPYIVGLSGTGPGAIVVAIGAVVLGAAGVGALASDRHAHEVEAV
ncbi:MAG: hypothetical protein K0S97_2017 [Chloroflexota bacterium]|jgi:hypothetical protein|nr:hypothetical protein [Chloroflexota bacterium]